VATRHAIFLNQWRRAISFPLWPCSASFKPPFSKLPEREAKRRSGDNGSLHQVGRIPTLSIAFLIFNNGIVYDFDCDFIQKEN